MVNKKELYKIYLRNLEDSIIKEISKMKKITIKKAMDYYYKSRLCDLIENNENGICYLDYKYLACEIVKWN